MEYKVMYIGCTENGYGPEGLCLGKIFSIRKDKEDSYVLMEECAGYHTEILSKEEVKTMIKELNHYLEITN